MSDTRHVKTNSHGGITLDFIPSGQMCSGDMVHGPCVEIEGDTVSGYGDQGVFWRETLTLEQTVQLRDILTEFIDAAGGDA